MNLPPSKYLGLPWEPWGDTDCLFDRAVNEHERRMCSCGCGHWYSETHGLDANNEPHDPGEWVVVPDVCNARAAMDKWFKDNKDHEPGTMVYTEPRPVVTADGEG